MELAWTYYLRAAQLGSPEAQMALAQAYSGADRRDDEVTMLQCAYQQGHGAAAYSLGIKAEVDRRYSDAINIFQQSVKFGSEDCAAAMELLFANVHGPDVDEDEKKSLSDLGITADIERKTRYNAIYDALKINPDLKLSSLDQVLPLPPAKLPAWSGVMTRSGPSPPPLPLTNKRRSEMSLKIITVGDSTDHGGKVISGSPTHDIGGKAIARLGDEVQCPQSYPGGAPHGVNKIVTAHETLTAGGIPVAVHGCKTACGCTLIGKVNATVG